VRNIERSGGPRPMPEVKYILKRKTYQRYKGGWLNFTTSQYYTSRIITIFAVRLRSEDRPSILAGS